MIDQLKQAQAPDEVIQAALKRIAPADEHCEVWEENWQTVQVFLFLESQWNVVVGAAGRMLWQGIKYPCVALAMRRYKVPPGERDRMWDDIRIMERAAREVLNKS